MGLRVPLQRAPDGIPHAMPRRRRWQHAGAAAAARMAASGAGPAWGPTEVRTMQARVRVALMLGGAALAGTAIFLGFRSQPGPQSESLPVDLPVAGDVPAVVTASAAVAKVVVARPVTAGVPVIVVSSTDARALLRQARAHLEAGEPAAAAPLTQRALELRPEDAGAWNVLGRTELALQRTSEAAAAFRRACDLDSANAYAHNNLGWLYLQQGRWNDALPLLERAVHLRHDVAYFHNNLGVAYERLGRWNEASAAYAQAVQLEPGRVNARLSLARVAAHLDPALAAATVAAVDSTTSGHANPADR